MSQQAQFIGIFQYAQLIGIFTAAKLSTMGLTGPQVTEDVLKRKRPVNLDLHLFFCLVPVAVRHFRTFVLLWPTADIVNILNGTQTPVSLTMCC